MKEVFQRIWEMSLVHQAFRDDDGHAHTVTDYAMKLLELIDANEDVVIPAAMLHDIGWSQLTEKERFLQFNPTRTLEEEKQVRIKHQIEGVKLAKKILEDADYPSEHVKNILEIISQHDTRKGFLSEEDGLVRDADKLWRFSKLGVSQDLKRFRLTFQQNKERLLKDMEHEDFFFLEASREIALSELEEREKELCSIQAKETP